MGVFYISISRIAYELDKEYFDILKKNDLDYLNRVNGYYLKHMDMHSDREKINRTRK